MSKEIPISEDKLRNLYINQNKSTYQIAKIYSCDPTVIQKRLKKYNIQIRYPKKKIEISKELLYNLYYKEKLSTYKIAKKLKIGRTTIYMKIIEHNIKTRPLKRVPIKKEILTYLYYKKRLPLSKIAKIYNCSHSIVLDKMKNYNLKRRDNSEANTLYPKKKFEGNKTKKAYMIGFRLGDLYVRPVNKNSKIIMIGTNTTKTAQVNLIKKVFGCYGHYNLTNSKGVYSVYCNLDKSFSFLIPKEDKIEDWILSNEEYFFSFLAGYTDAEGNIGVYCKKARYRIGSYDKNILTQIYKKLKENNFNTKFRLETKKGIYKNRKYNGDFYRISINEKIHLLKFLRKIKPYLKHEKRLRNLGEAENNIIERNKKYNTRIINE